MKKQKIALSALALAALISFSACTKKEKNPLSSGSGVKQTQKGGTSLSINAVYLPSMHDCDPWMRINCCITDPVVIRPKLSDLLKGGLDVSPKVVANVFTDPSSEEVCRSLGPELSGKLKSGLYSVKEMNATSGHVTFIAGVGQELNEQNLEFAFTLNN
ncbi:MAG: hypothetical protein QM743_05490 [Chitinophagaceae bacterium]